MGSSFEIGADVENKSSSRKERREIYGGGTEQGRSGGVIFLIFRDISA
jgi:hypothetical protein